MALLFLVRPTSIVYGKRGKEKSLAICVSYLSLNFATLLWIIELVYVAFCVPSVCRKILIGFQLSTFVFHDLMCLKSF